MTVIDKIEERISTAYNKGLIPKRLIIGKNIYAELREEMSVPGYMEVGEIKGVLILIDPVNKERIHCEANLPASRKGVWSNA